MKLYLAIIKFNWLKILSYPFEIIAFFACRFAALGFLALFWYAVARSSGGAMDFRPLVAYFLVAAAVKDLTFSTDTKFGKAIQVLIKGGDISNYFIKPTRTVPFLLSAFIGENGMGLIYALISLTLGLIILPPLGLINILSFLVFLIFAFVVSVCFNLLIGMLSFYFTEADGFRNAINHVIKILSGALIPLNLFPFWMKGVILLLPFPALIFTPTYVLQNTLSLIELSSFFITALVWSIILIIITRYLWRYSLKHYEGVGI